MVNFEQKITNKLQIKEMVVSYFHNLLGTVNSVVTHMFVDDLQIILRYTCPSIIVEELLKIPSEEHIRSVIFSIPNNKALGHMDLH